MSRVLNICLIVIACIAMPMSNAHSVYAQVEATGGAGSRSTPRFQSRAEIAALPPSLTRNTVRAGFTPNPVTTNNQVASNNGSLYRTASAQTDVYPYPASRSPRVAIQSNYTLPRSVSNSQLSNQLSIGSSSTIGRLRNTSQQSSFPSPAFYPTQAPRQAPTQLTTAYRQPIYQTPTLGLGTTSTRASQTCNCQPNYNPVAGRNRTTVAYQAPSFNSAVGSGLAAAPLDIQVPGQQNFNQPTSPQNGQPNFQPNDQYQPTAAPQSGAQGASWWTPFVTGSGTYTPVVRRQNMPVGTYLGQGFIGQPTAYVDGQPVRNLFRYVFP